MENCKKMEIPKEFLCGWISPNGDIHKSLPHEQERISDALCRELLGKTIPLPGEYLEEQGWLRIRMERRVEFKVWPTDKQYDVLKEYGLTKASPQDECMFKVSSTKKSRDPFLRPDVFEGEDWYEEFSLFRSTGVCRVPTEQVFEVREALTRCGYETYTRDGGEKHPGQTWIAGGDARKRELCRKIAALIPEGKSGAFSIVSLETDEASLEDIVASGFICDEDLAMSSDALSEAILELQESGAERVQVSSSVFSIGKGELEDLPDDAVELVKEYGADDFICLDDVDQINRFDFGIQLETEESD